MTNPILFHIDLQITKFFSLSFTIILLILFPWQFLSWLFVLFLLLNRLILTFFKFLGLFLLLFLLSWAHPRRTFCFVIEQISFLSSRAFHSSHTLWIEREPLLQIRYPLPILEISLSIICHSLRNPAVVRPKSTDNFRINQDCLASSFFFNYSR